MKKIFIIIITHLIVCSCNDSKEFHHERIQILEETAFNIEVFNSINQYRELKDIIISDINSILPNGKPQGLINYNYAENVFQPALPNFSNKEIADRFQSVFLELGNKKIKSISVKRDSLILFNICSTPIPQYRSDIKEWLTFNKKKRINKVMTPYSKDTTFNNWTYKIWVDKRYGW